jgi:hypothetical protein
MARAAPTLIVDIATNLSRLASDMGQAKGIVERSMRDIEKSVNFAKSALGAIGVAVSAGALVKLTADAIKATAALDDMAEATGASVENLSRLQQIARIGGHDFGSLTDGIGRMIKGLKGADEEGQAAGRALDFLGVKAKDSNGRFRDSGEILFEVSKALSQYEDGGNKVALVQDLLGKGAAKYLPLLKDMAEMSDVQARVTAQQAAEAEKFEKALNRVGLALDESKRVMIMGWLPAWREFAEEMSEGIRLFGGFGSALYNIGVGIDPFKSHTENIAQMRGQLEAIEGLRSAGVPTGDPDTLRKRIAFVQYQQRQQAMRLATPDTLDARDLALQNMARPLNYQGGKADDSITKEANRLREEDARNWVRHIEEAQKASEALAYTWDEGGKRVAMTAEAWQKIVDLQEKGEEIFRKALGSGGMDGMIEAIEEMVQESEKLVYTWNEFGERIAVSRDAANDPAMQSIAVNDAAAESAKAFEQAVATGIMLGFRRGSGGLAQSLTGLIGNAIMTATLTPIATRIGGAFSPLGQALAGQGGSWVNSAGNWLATSQFGQSMGWSTTTDEYNVGLAPTAGFMSGAAKAVPYVGMALAVASMMRDRESRAQTDAMFREGEAHFGMTGDRRAQFNPFGSWMAGDRSFGDMLQGMAAPGIFKTKGNAQRQGGITAAFGQSGTWRNEGWFADDMVPGLNSLVSSIASGEQNLIRNLGLTPEQIARTDAALGSANTRRYGFGMEHTDWTQSGAAEQIMADRMAAISQALGKSIEDLTRIMSTSTEEWQRAMRDMEAAVQGARDSLSGSVRGLPGQLGIASLEGFERSLAMAEWNAPTDRLASARGFYETTLARARGGDLSAVMDFGSSAQNLLGIGRETYASGGGFQDILGEVKGALAELDAQQRSIQADILRSVPVAIMEASNDQVAELKRGFASTVAKLGEMEAELRRWRNTA